MTFLMTLKIHYSAHKSLSTRAVSGCVTKAEGYFMRSPERTYDVHEREDVVLHVLLAMEANHGVVHGQQHLDVVVFRLCVPPLALGLGQFVFHDIHSCGKVRDPEISNCRNTVSKETTRWLCGIWTFLCFLQNNSFAV